ncbi:PHB depolymerase family esterase [Cellulomonas sp. 179-A 9B4 NHS]|uniref:extracellular catalytic domain type 1 short-chain-length polyhydroxyalkanoate depolymerase n=1 Tax=Cellulomonas sp. 179-A 9B4 NHS TaxID=3142379 RepID=UPI0039A197C2
MHPFRVLRTARRRLTAAVAALALAAAGGAALTATALPAQAASLVEVSGFGTNPGGLRMHLFVPDRLPANPGVLVVVHYCTGSAQAMYSGAQFDELASQHGFIAIYPSTNRPGNCFDVSSANALVRDGGSDPQSIVQMVRHVQSRYATDTSRVFVTGVSSGAMTTQLLLAAYPDVFAAGAAFAGVPATCFVTNQPKPGTTAQAGWNSECAQGRRVQSARLWGDAARAAYPGYTGPRPRVQLWHGVNDETLSYVNHGEAVKQWTDVLGLPSTPASTETIGNRTRQRYGGTGDQAPLEANSLANTSHNLPVDAAAAIRFFGLDRPGPTTSPTPTPTVTPTATPTPTPTPTATPTSTPTATPTGACSVTWGVNQWNTGFTATVTVRNTGTAAVTGWTLTWAFPSGQQVTQAWSSVVTQSGAQVSARPAAWNGTIPAGGSVQIGFNGTHTGTNGTPTGFALNGTACSLV